MTSSMSDSAPLVFRLHAGTPSVVRKVLLEQGWEEYDEEMHKEDDWNLYWRVSAFHNSDYQNLKPWQRLNHHPKVVGITRKDSLARNLRRMKGAFGSALYNFSPVAFILPNDYTRFLEAYTVHHLANGGRATYWICKPVDLSRGRGIFVFRDIKDLVYDSPVVVQKYISNPLLISGYKFDLRIYVCVKSFCPLIIYIHQEGLVRFATEKFSLTSLDNVFAHLTNTSINKFGPRYSTDKEHVGQGCKWTLNKFRCFLRSQNSNELLLWQQINNIVTLTLLAATPSAPFSPNCVELLGFDVLIDENFKPWLLEVNYSPALSLDCPADNTVKKALIHDLIDLMNYSQMDGLRQRGYLTKRFINLCYSQALQTKTSPVYLIPKHTPGFTRQKRSHSQPRSSFEKNEDKLVQSGGLCYSETCQRTLLASCAQEPLYCPQSRHLMPKSKNRCVSNLEGHKTVNMCKLPSIHKYQRQIITWVETQDVSVPPCRVGDFILTFPFNDATLKASQENLDVKIAFQELHRLNNHLAAFCNLKDERRKECVRRSWAGKFESVFWGPRNPPLLKDCFLLS